MKVRLSSFSFIRLAEFFLASSKGRSFWACMMLSTSLASLPNFWSWCNVEEVPKLWLTLPETPTNWLKRRLVKMLQLENLSWSDCSSAWMWVWIWDGRAGWVWKVYWEFRQRQDVTHEEPERSEHHWVEIAKCDEVDQTMTMKMLTCRFKTSLL